MSATRRLPALDGLRGCLALLVAVYHLSDPCFATPLLTLLAQDAIGVFFILSGLVLVRGWDGRYGLFLVRRFIRLWPTFALSALAGFWITGLPIDVRKFFWLPIAPPFHNSDMNGPAWTLFVEAWAMPFLPILVWASRRLIRAAGVAIAIVYAAAMLRPEIMFGELFLLGACLYRVQWRHAGLESAWAQWLGKVSYSLYLIPTAQKADSQDYPTRWNCDSLAWSPDSEARDEQTSAGHAFGQVSHRPAP